MTVEKLKTAIANIEAYLSECPSAYDTVTLTANVIRSVKENYEELVEAKAEIERLEVNLKEAFEEIEALKQINLHCKAEAVKEFAETVKANKTRLFNYIYSERGFDKQIDNLKKEMVGTENGNH